LPIGALRDDPDIWAMYRALLHEVADVGHARGLALAPDIVDTISAFLRGLPPHQITSMATDVIRGNRLELPWLSGKVVALGREYGVPTPANAFIYAALKPYVNGRPAQPA
jgi:2-dehydropantoate 2-reductase